MLVAAAVCPHPPLLVPGVDAGEGAEGAALRAACLDAVSCLAGARPDLVVAVGGAAEVGPYPEGARGSLARYGVDLPPATRPAPATLPLPLTIARWLLDESSIEVPSLLFGIPTDTEAARCADLGAGLAQRAERVAMLVMGDGSARRSVKGPGFLDDRAEPFDVRVATALGEADADALLALEPLLADALLVAGRAPWQVLAGAAQASGGSWHGAVHYAAAPFGVAYLVATLRPAQGEGTGADG
ncbi:MAG: hypothetical protein ACXV2I_13315 [Actinomycetes bacterium]